MTSPEELQIKELQRQLIETKRHLSLSDEIIEDLDKQVQSQDAMLRYLHTTVSSMRLVNRIKRIFQKIVPAKIWNIFDNQGEITNEGSRSRAYIYHEPVIDISITNEILSFGKKPLISIILPAYNADPKWLDQAIKSVKKQWYENWELSITYKNSAETALKHLETLEHPKIKLIPLGGAQNFSGLPGIDDSLITGDYIALMDAKDELAPDALYEMVKVIDRHGAEFVYSDEDRLKNDRYTSPHFKPDFSYDLLLSFNYIGRFAIIKTEIFKQIDPIDFETDDGSFLDIYLKTIEKTDKTAHIPKILYHRRRVEGEAAKNPQNIAIIQKHFERMGIDARVSSGEKSPFWDIAYALPRPKPLVSIIIPTKDAIGYLDDCIQSIIALSTYQNFEILILNNNSEKEETFEWLGNIQEKYSFIQVLEANYPFNWSKLNNHGMSVSNGDVFIFLNNDIKIITPDWIERLASRALQPKVGTVGALLLFEDDTIQHSGVVAGWGHIYRTCEQRYDHTPFVSPMATRNVSSSTGACLAVSRKTIEDIGLFDEEYLIADSDIVLSLRALEKGYRNVLDAETKLYHYESKTRDNYVPECDLKRARRDYHHYRKNGDPFFNSNLILAEYMPTLAHQGQ